MICPFCARNADRVIDSRSLGDGSAIRRRRECTECGKRYTTYERIERMPMRVLKKDGIRAPYDRGKILSGMMKACEKRPIADEVLQQAVERIESELIRKHDREIPTREIGRLVMRELRKLDQVAYVRFASVYREFQDIAEFVNEIEPMVKRAGRGK